MRQYSVLQIGVALILGAVTISCGLMSRPGAVSAAKADLKATAKEKGQEITEIEVDTYSYREADPADRANGIQAYATVYLDFAHRCSREENWTNGSGYYGLRKINGKWGIDPGAPGALFGVRLRDCALPTPTAGPQFEIELWKLRHTRTPEATP